MLYLTRFYDNTYFWTNGIEASDILKTNEAIAYGYWNYQIPKHEITYGIELVVRLEYDTVFFSESTKLMFDIQKIHG